MIKFIKEATQIIKTLGLINIDFCSLVRSASLEDVEFIDDETK